MTRKITKSHARQYKNDKYFVESLKARYDVPGIWEKLGLEGAPRAGKNVSCPFHDDKNPSFSISRDGKLWHCFSCGKGGDIIRLVEEVKRCGFEDALRWLNGGSLEDAPIKRKITNQKQDNAMIKELEPKKLCVKYRMPYLRGCKQLASEDNASFSENIDEWRAWRPGTTRTLANMQLMSLLPNGLAFGVYRPLFFDSLGVSWELIGYHLRFGFDMHPVNRPVWSYIPKQSEAGYSIGGYPFVLGDITTAKKIAILEGQWDAICFASCAGWLSNGTFPAGKAVVGIRGKSAVRPFLDAFLPHIHDDALFCIFPDKDGTDDWRRELSYELKSAGRWYYMYTIPASNAACKDFTDLAREESFSEDDIKHLIKEKDV